jgi:hypothetical protein
VTTLYVHVLNHIVTSLGTDLEPEMPERWRS